MSQALFDSSLVLFRSRWAMILPFILASSWLFSIYLLIVSGSVVVVGWLDALCAAALLGAALCIGGFLSVLFLVRWFGVRYGVVRITKRAVAWRVLGGWKVIPERVVNRISLVEKLGSYDIVIRLPNADDAGDKIVIRGVRLPLPLPEIIEQIPSVWRGKVGYGDPVI